MRPRTRLLGACCILTLGATSPLLSQAPFSVGAFVGVSEPAGNARQVIKTGWLAGVWGAYRLGQGQGLVGFRLDLAYSENKNVDPPPGVTTDLTLKNFYGLAYLLFHVLPADRSMVDFYFGGGGGVVRVQESYGPNQPAPLTNQSSTSTKGAVSGILGIALPVARNVRLFGEGRFLVVFTEGQSTNFIPADIGVEILVGMN